jgi:lipopolysaccharide export LptBFGC system permease protein LptF
MAEPGAVGVLLMRVILMRVIRYLITLVAGLILWLSLMGVVEYVVKGDIDPSLEVWVVRVVVFVLVYTLWVFNTSNRIREWILR